MILSCFVQTIQSHVMPATGRIYRNNKWEQTGKVFSNYGPGVRIVSLESAGLDPHRPPFSLFTVSLHPPLTLPPLPYPSLIPPLPHFSFTLPFSPPLPIPPHPSPPSTSPIPFSPPHIPHSSQPFIPLQPFLTPSPSPCPTLSPFSPVASIFCRNIKIPIILQMF